MVKVDGQAGGSGDEGVEAVRNLAHFEHKRTLFNMGNTIFSLTSGVLNAHATAGGSKGSGGDSPCPVTLTTGSLIS